MDDHSSTINPEVSATWSPELYDIIEGMYIKVNVESYHDGKFGRPNPPFEHSMPVQLWFVPGPVLTNSGSVAGAVYQKIVVDGVFQQDEFKNEMIKRLQPIFQSVSDDAEMGRSVLLKVPGISCGCFGGVWATKQENFMAQKGLYNAVNEILSSNEYKGIKAVVLDTYLEGSLGEKTKEN